MVTSLAGALASACLHRTAVARPPRLFRPSPSRAADYGTGPKTNPRKNSRTKTNLERNTAVSKVTPWSDADCLGMCCSNYSNKSQKNDDRPMDLYYWTYYSTTTDFVRQHRTVWRPEMLVCVFAVALLSSSGVTRGTSLCIYCRRSERHVVQRLRARGNVELVPVAPTSIKSPFNWTEFIFERRFEPSSSHISSHQLELGSSLIVVCATGLRRSRITLNKCWQQFDLSLAQSAVQVRQRSRHFSSH